MSFFLSSSQKDMQHPRSVYGAAATIALIAGISNIISLTSGSSHICEDALGVETFNTQWVEWMVTVPLLGYVALAIEDKRQFTKDDILTIVSMFLMIFFGFAMNFVKNAPVYGWVLYSLGGLCYGGLLRKALQSRRLALVAQMMKKTTTSLSTSWEVERSTMKYRLSALLLVVMPLFPLVYLLRYTRIIGR
jgi:hypothetical protein